MGLGPPVCLRCNRVMDLEEGRPGSAWYCPCGIDASEEHRSQISFAFCFPRDHEFATEPLLPPARSWLLDP